MLNSSIKRKGACSYKQIKQKTPLVLITLHKTCKLANGLTDSELEEGGHMIQLRSHVGVEQRVEAFPAAPEHWTDRIVLNVIIRSKQTLRCPLN